MQRSMNGLIHCLVFGMSCMRNYGPESGKIVFQYSLSTEQVPYSFDYVGVFLKAGEPR